MSSHEFAEWVAYSRLEPWGWETENYRAGLIASTIANTVRNPKKRKKPFTPEEFMPQIVDDPPRGKSRSVDQDSLRAKIDAAMFAFGGRK